MARSLAGSLAGSKRKMEFELKKEFFKKIATSLTCNFCKMVPKQGPFYISKDGDGRMACSDCKDEKLPNSVPNPCAENILQALPLVACRYRKNDCQVVQDPENISYHEEDCEFREVDCYYGYCKKSVAFSKFLSHVEASHDNMYTARKPSILEGSKLSFKFRVKDGILDKNTRWGSLFEFNGKNFLLHVDFEISSKIWFAWVQMYGSKFEAKNYKYSIQLKENEDLGTPFYKGPMKSVDDRKTEVIKSKIGLVVVSDVLSKHLNEKHAFEVVVQIEDLKPKDDEMDRDSEVSNEGE